MARPATDKKQRLIEAAIERFHSMGYARASLADVATAAGIPKGNVFYYFKTKEELVRAVVDQWCRLMEGYLSVLEPLPDARRRIEGFLDQSNAMSKIYATLGCPIAGLARDLKQEGGELSQEAGRIYAVQFEWLKKQFIDVGLKPKKATELAQFLFSGYHGAILLSHAQSDPNWIANEVNALKNWIKEIVD